VSALMPYVYVLVLGAALIAVTLLNLALAAMQLTSLVGSDSSALGGWLGRALGLVGEALLFASIYRVMPYGHVPTRHALIGGVTCALLWELVRRFLVWWFTNVSMLNVIYGTFATVIVVLLSMEIAAIILLLGAQVIAEYERLKIPGRVAGAPSIGAKP
jgi:membrane protein